MALSLDKAHICLLSTKTISNDGGVETTCSYFGTWSER